jgi:hypothetical protein
VNPLVRLTGTTLLYVTAVAVIVALMVWATPIWAVAGVVASGAALLGWYGLCEKLRNLPPGTGRHRREDPKRDWTPKIAGPVDMVRSAWFTSRAS